MKALFGTYNTCRGKRNVDLQMSTYIPKIVYTMYRNRIREITNTTTYPECRDTRCRDNGCQLYRNLLERICII